MSSSSSPSRESVVLKDPTDPSDLRGTPILPAVFPDGRAFLEAFHPARGPAGEIALDTRVPVPAGKKVVLEIVWPALPNRIYVRAKVARRRGGLTARLYPDDTAVRDFLERIANVLPADFHKRAHRRYCVRLLVRWRKFGDVRLCEARAEDLSAGGVLLATWDPMPAVGERVSVRVFAPSAAQDLVLIGTVRHVRPRGEAGVFGVEFVHRSSAEHRSLRRLLRVFAARGVVILESGGFPTKRS